LASSRGVLMHGVAAQKLHDGMLALTGRSHAVKVRPWLQGHAQTGRLASAACTDLHRPVAELAERAC